MRKNGDFTVLNKSLEPKKSSWVEIKRIFHVATYMMHLWSSISLISSRQLFLKSIRIFALNINCYLDQISTNYMS